MKPQIEERFIYINRTFNRLSIHGGSDDKYISLSVYGARASGGAHHYDIALTPLQAIQCANELLHPQSAKDEYEQKAHSCKHGNRVFKSGWAARREERKWRRGANASTVFSVYDYEDGGKKTAFFPATDVLLSDETIQRVAGLLFLWAGSRLTGLLTVKKTVHTVIINTEDKPVEE